MKTQNTIIYIPFTNVELKTFLKIGIYCLSQKRFRQYNIIKNTRRSKGNTRARVFSGLNGTLSPRDQFGSRGKCMCVCVVLYIEVSGKQFSFFLSVILNRPIVWRTYSYTIGVYMYMTHIRHNDNVYLRTRTIVIATKRTISII